MGKRLWLKGFFLVISIKLTDETGAANSTSVRIVSVSSLVQFRALALANGGPLVCVKNGNWDWPSALA